MGHAAGTFLRVIATFFYALEFCCAAIILGVYSYFLSVLSNHNLPISRDWKAVEGISGIAVLYTILAVLTTCCLGGVKFFAFVAMLLDFCFCAAFVALAVLTRDGANSCSSNVTTPLGNGPSDNNGPGYGQNGFGFGGGKTVTYFPHLGFACRVNTAAFAVAIIGALLFLVSIFLQVWVARHHQKEKKYGPSPANNYTSGSGRRKFWQRKPKATNDLYAKDTEMHPMNGGGSSDAHAGLATDTTNPYATGGVPAGGQHSFRPSGDTGYTGTTAGGGDYYTGGKLDHGGYHTGPTGTSVNPYGYDNSKPVASSNF